VSLIPRGLRRNVGGFSLRFFLVPTVLGARPKAG
jgi:hypothetical protein